MKIFKFLMVSLMLAVTLLHGVPVSAQTTQSDQQKRVASVKTRIEKRSRERETAKVKLGSGTTYVGVIRSAGDQTFEIVDKAGSAHVVSYADVKSINGKGISSGAKIGIGAAIGAGVVLAILGLIIASDN